MRSINRQKTKKVSVRATRFTTYLYRNCNGVLYSSLVPPKDSNNICVGNGTAEFKGYQS